MALLTQLGRADEALKVFPLPSIVLFPGGAQPLHIFEPRYRELLRDCLAGDKVLALAQLQPGWEADYQGRPPLAPVCCAGVVVWHELLPDGRYNLVFHGVVRARVKAELPPRHPYREVRAEWMPDDDYTGPEEEALRRALLHVAGRVPAVSALLEAATRVAGGALADLVASAIVHEVGERQALLAEADVGKRLRTVVDHLGDVIARIERPTGPAN